MFENIPSTFFVISLLPILIVALVIVLYYFEWKEDINKDQTTGAAKKDDDYGRQNPSASAKTGSGETSTVRRRKITINIDEDKLEKARDARVDALLFHNRGFPKLRDMKNKEAMGLFLETYNATRSPDEIDVHELFVDEAKEAIALKMKKAVENGRSSKFRIIIGESLEESGASGASDLSSSSSSLKRLKNPIMTFLTNDLGLNNCAADPENGVINVQFDEVKPKTKVTSSSTRAKKD